MNVDLSKAKRVRTDCFVVVPDGSTVEEVERTLAQRGVTPLGRDEANDGRVLVKYQEVRWDEEDRG